MTDQHVRAWLLLGAIAVSGWLSGCRARQAAPEPAATAAVGASSGAATATTHVTAEPPIRVVALGDSLTAGYGLDSAAEAYPALIEGRLRAEGLRVEVVNAGVSGDTSAGGLRRLAWALDGHAHVLIVALGGNDALRGLPVDDLRRNLDTIISQAKQGGTAVVLAGMEAPPNLGPAYTAAFRAVYRDLAARHRVELVPFLLEGVAGQTTLNQGDGIHPNRAGTARVAENLWPAVERAVRAATHP